MTESTSATLLDRVRDTADQASWREFDAKYRELILRYAQRRGLQPADAEDVRQLVMMRLASCIPKFEYEPKTGRFRDFLGTVARNVVWTQLKRRQNTTRSLAMDAPVEAPQDEETWSDEWRLHHFRQAMGQVRTTFGSKSLEVFEGLLEGLSPAAVAQAHNTTLDNVYKIKQRIRDRLRELITRQLDEEEFSKRRSVEPTR